MARLIELPPRFTHSEWTCSNLTKYTNANADRQNAERLIAESLRLEEETEKKAKKTQNDVNRKFDQRLKDLTFWRQELDEKLDGISKEIDNLKAFKNRVGKALEACNDPLEIAKQCLANRERRLGIDLVHDSVQKELLKEIEIINGVQSLLTRTEEQAKEQLRCNRKAQYRLNKDHRDKTIGIDIDKYCQKMKDHYSNLHFNSEATNIDPKLSVSLHEWQEFTNDIIQNAERERELSASLRSMIDSILQQTANDMKKQCEAVNFAFECRISETRDAKQKLEDNLNKISGQILEMDENIAKLKISINKKECPLKLSETRLDERTRRPNMELCRDPVQYRLIEESGELRRSIRELQKYLGQSQRSLKSLIQNQRELEDEIRIKSNTLFIDEVECMGLRKSIHYQTF